MQCTYALPVGRRGPKGPRKKKRCVLAFFPLRLCTFELGGVIGGIHCLSKLEMDADGSRPETSSDSAATPGQAPLAVYAFDDERPGSSAPAQGSAVGFSPSLDSYNMFAGAATPQDTLSPSWAITGSPCSTDQLCSRKVLRQIVDDYILYLFPAIPVFHLPTFRAQFDLERDRHDTAFFGLVMGIVAITVGILPRKFQMYRQTPYLQRFATRLEMIDFCYTLTLQTRGLRYFDEISHTKWATAYVTYLAYFHVGKYNISRTVECEANLFARLLELHRISAYAGLNCIETQLRKKAFWLTLYAYVHLQYANLRKERLGFIDCAILHEIDLESLLPVPHDDEYITEMSYGSPDPNVPSLAEGFNWRSKVFWCAIRELHRPTHERRRPAVCQCTRFNDMPAYQRYLESRLRDLKYVLDSAPRYLRQWISPSYPHTPDDPTLHIRECQIEIIRVDIHVTHVWLQSIIMDQAELSRTHPPPVTTSPATTTILSPASATSSATAKTAVDLARADWAHREDLCRQLLQILYSASELGLETLGVILVQKTRDTAISLLNCPYDDEEDDHRGPSNTGADGGGRDRPAARAKAYLADFTRKLQELDKTEGSSSLSIQSWVDTDRTTRREVRSLVRW